MQLYHPKQVMLNEIIIGGNALKFDKKDKWQSEKSQAPRVDISLNRKSFLKFRSTCLGAARRLKSVKQKKLKICTSRSS